MTDQSLSVRTLSRRAMDHALALALPHAGEAERNALLATALCVDVVPAALGAGLADAASLLRDPLLRGQARAFIHSIVASMAGNQGAAILTEIEKGINAVLPGFVGMPEGMQAIPHDSAPFLDRPHWRRVSRAAEVSDEATEAADVYLMDDPKGLPVGARFVPGSLRVREFGPVHGEGARWVSLTVRMMGADGVEVERRSGVPSPASRSFRSPSGPLHARLTVTPEGFPCVELVQPLVPLKDASIVEVTSAPQPPAPLKKAPAVEVAPVLYPPDLTADPAAHPGDDSLARHVHDVLATPTPTP